MNAEEKLVQELKSNEHVIQMILFDYFQMNRE